MYVCGEVAVFFGWTLPPTDKESYLAQANYLNRKGILETRKFWGGVMVVRRHRPPFQRTIKIPMAPIIAGWCSK